MGNQSGAEYGGIMIRTDKPLYFAGDIVTGNIYLHITKAGYNGSTVSFTIVGKEKTRWTTGSGKHRRTHYGKNIFHTQTVVIHQFQDQNLQIGQFVFPFQLHMPPNLPGSYLHSSFVFASLTYKVKVRVMSANKSINDIKNKQEIILREPIKEMIHMQVQNDSSQITTWCCVKQGTSSIKCQVEKSHYFPGETVQITFDVDNSNCKLNIEKLEVFIFKELQISNGYSSARRDFIINTVSLEGVGAGNQISPIQKRTCQLVLQNIQNPAELLPPTTNGNFVKSLYFVKIKPHYEGCTCCTSIPNITVPITILAVIPPGYIQVPAQQPENWHPQDFQPQVIQYQTQQPFGQPNQNLQQMANPMNF